MAYFFLTRLNWDLDDYLLLDLWYSISQQHKNNGDLHSPGNLSKIDILQMIDTVYKLKDLTGEMYFKNQDRSK